VKRKKPPDVTTLPKFPTDAAVWKSA